MGFKLNKDKFNFGKGTGSSPNKIGTELLISGGLEVGNKALELFEKGPNTKSGKKYEYHTNPKLGNKPPPGRKYRIDTRSGEIHLLPEEYKNDKKIEVPDWAYEAANVENPNKPKEDTPKEDPPKKDPPKKDPPKVDPPKVDPPKVDPPKEDKSKEEVVEDKKKKKKKSKFRYNF